MSPKIISMGIIATILSFFGACKESSSTIEEAVESFGRSLVQPKRKVSWEEARNGEIKNVQIEFKTEELILKEPVDLLSSSKLQSKTTTILTAELFVSTNLKFESKPVYVNFKLSKRVPKHLKTKRNRQPYLDQVIKEIKETYKEVKNPLKFDYITDTSFDKQFENAVVLKAIKK